MYAMLAQPAGLSASKRGFSNSRPATTIGAHPRPTCHAVREIGGSGMAEKPKTVPRANRTAAPKARSVPRFAVALVAEHPRFRAADGDLEVGAVPDGIPPRPRAFRDRDCAQLLRFAHKLRPQACLQLEGGFWRKLAE